VLRRLEEVLRHRPRKIFLWVGINDLLLRSSVSETTQRYQSVVQRIREQSPDTELYLMSVLPINNEVKNIGIENTLIQALNLEIAKIARAYALPYIDIYPQLSDAQGRLAATFTSDGIHLNGKAYTIIRQAIVPWVQR
jgi:lysophospholipase L1-like esterase